MLNTRTFNLGLPILMIYDKGFKRKKEQNMEFIC